ncbi:cobyrinate a,c-diamide synthase [bacterium]|nr:cobyrinate a,c-diamide synthase [bacterium]
MTSALVVSGLRSGVGKTTVTLGLIRAFSAAGLKVAALKVGPDFLDPSHYRAAGAAVSRNVDPILQGNAGMRKAFAVSAGSDITLIEGVMGLFDGPIPGKTTASTADVAARLGVPVLLVCDARSCAQSIAAEIIGARRLLGRTPLLGVILNFVGSKRHADLLTRGVHQLAKTPVLGCLFRDSLTPIPSRHLGLVSGMEMKTTPYEEYGRALSAAVQIDRLANAARSLKKKIGPSAPRASGKTNGGRLAVRVGIARDEAFTFYYPESLEYFQNTCEEVTFFSPLTDPAPPPADLYYFGGGFPEIYARRLSANRPFREALRQNLQAGAKAYAECGGLMYLSKAIIATDGREYPMTDHLPGSCIMHKTRQALGYWRAKIRSKSLFLDKAETLVGHEYHWSSYVPAGLKTIYQAEKIGARGELKDGGWISQNTFASYLHLSPLGNPGFFRRLVEWAER